LHVLNVRKELEGTCANNVVIYVTSDQNTCYQLERKTTSTCLGFEVSDLDRFKVCQIVENGKKIKKIHS